MKASDVHPSFTSLIERFHSVLYPFPLERLFEELPEQGWIVPKLSRDEGSLKLSGAATKGGATLAFEQNNKTLGIRGTDPGETLAAFRDLRAFVVGRYGIGPEVESHYTELRYVGTADTSAPPTRTVPEMLREWWSGHPRSDALSEKVAPLLGEERLGAYGLRMATVGKDANRADWTELTVGPTATSGHRIYSFDLIFRRGSRSEVERLAEVCRELIIATVEELES